MVAPDGEYLQTCQIFLTDDRAQFIPGVVAVKEGDKFPADPCFFFEIFQIRLLFPADKLMDMKGSY